MVVDREKDVQLLTNKLQGIMDRGGDIIHIMEIQREILLIALADLKVNNNKRLSPLYKDESTRLPLCKSRKLTDITLRPLSGIARPLSTTSPTHKIHSQVSPRRQVWALMYLL
jgi:hypothetical protein